MSTSPSRSPTPTAATRQPSALRCRRCRARRREDAWSSTTCQVQFPFLLHFSPAAWRTEFWPQTLRRMLWHSSSSGVGRVGLLLDNTLDLRISLRPWLSWTSWRSTVVPLEASFLIAGGRTTNVRAWNYGNAAKIFILTNIFSVLHCDFFINQPY